VIVTYPLVRMNRSVLFASDAVPSSLRDRTAHITADRIVTPRAGFYLAAASLIRLAGPGARGMTLQCRRVHRLVRSPVRVDTQ
jgi:hypothetical protein